MYNRISSAQKFQKARSRLQTPDPHTGCTNSRHNRTIFGGLANWLSGFGTAVEDNINMHLTETVEEGIDWIHVAGEKGK
jgi:hypothetical protein